MQPSIQPLPPPLRWLYIAGTYFLHLDEMQGAMRKHWYLTTGVWDLPVLTDPNNTPPQYILCCFNIAMFSIGKPTKLLILPQWCAGVLQGVSEHFDIRVGCGSSCNKANFWPHLLALKFLTRQGKLRCWLTDALANFLEIATLLFFDLWPCMSWLKRLQPITILKDISS